MGVQLIPLGGFEEIGRNCLAIDVNGKIIICDMGIHLERFIEASEDNIFKQQHILRKLIARGALPDLRLLGKKKRSVVAIICSHAHVDHIGALPFFAKRFDCPIYMTPFTAAVARSICQSRGEEISITAKKPSSTFYVAGMKIEFIPVAHSTPQSINIAIHTKEGIILYGNDYKNDDIALFNEKTDTKRLAQLRGNVKALVLDSLYAPTNEHAPGELIARKQVLDLQDTLKGHRTIVASTFSSHIYRIISLCDIADKLKRKIVFIGRSLSRYIYAAKDTHIVDLTKRGELITYTKHAARFLSRLEDPQKYFIITTGHQGEPDAMLTKMIEGLYSFTPDDVVVFSSRIIPGPVTENNSKVLREKIAAKGIRMISDIHVSGHGAAKDHKLLIEHMQPEYIVPSHAEEWMAQAMAKEAAGLGYTTDKIKLLKVGQKWMIE